MPNLPQIIDNQISNKIQGSKNKGLNGPLLSEIDGLSSPSFIGKEETRFNQMVRPAAPSVEYTRKSNDGVPRIAISITPVDHDELGHYYEGLGQKYVIYRGRTIIATIPRGETLYYEDYGVSSTEVVSYYVQVVDANGNSNISEQFAISARDNTIPNKPVTPVVVTDGVRTDSFGDACHGLLEYVQNEDPDFAYMKVYTKPFELADTAYAETLVLKSGLSLHTSQKWYAPIKGLVRGKRYSLKMQAFDHANNVSEDSDEAHFTAGDYTAPNPVRNVRAVDISTNIADLISVSWRRPDPNAYGAWDINKYEIYRGFANSGIANYSKIGEADYNDKPWPTEFIDSGITLGVPYVYGVRALDISANASSFSFSNKVNTSAVFDSPVVTITHTKSDLDMPIQIDWDADIMAKSLTDYRLEFCRTSDDQIVYCHVPWKSNPAGTISPWHPKDVITLSGHNTVLLTDFPYESAIQYGDTNNYYLRIVAGVGNMTTESLEYSKLIAKESFTYNPVPPTLSGLIGTFIGSTNTVNLRWGQLYENTREYFQNNPSYYGKVMGIEAKYFGTNSGESWNSGISVFRNTKNPSAFLYGVWVNAPEDTAPDDDTTYYYGVKAIADRERTPMFKGLWNFYGQKDMEEYYYSPDYTPIAITIEGTLKQPTDCIATGDKQKLNLQWSGTTATRLKEYKLYISDVSAADLNTPDDSQLTWRGRASQIVINKMPDGSQLSAVPKSYYFKLRPVDYRETAGADSVVFSGVTVDAVGPSIDTTTTVPALLPYAIINSATLRVNWMTTDETSNLSEVWGRVTKAGDAAGDWQKTTGLSGGINSGYFIFSGLTTSTWNYEIRALDSAANAGVNSKVFEVDTVQAADPDSIVLTQISKDTLGVQVNYGTLPEHFKTFDLYYRTNSGSWSYLDSHSAVAFSETIPANGYIDTKIIATKLHDAALNSPGAVLSNAVLIDSIAPAFLISDYTSDITADRLLGVGGGSTSAIRVDFGMTDAGAGLDDNSLLASLDAHLGTPFTNSGITYDTSDPHSRTGNYIESGITQGVHSLTFKSIDLAGNYSFTEPKWIEVDIVTPDAPTTPVCYKDGRSVYVSTSSPTQTDNFKEYWWYVNSGSVDTYMQATKDRYLKYTFPADIATQVNFKARQVKRNGVEGDLSSASNSVWIDITPPVLGISAVSNINQYGYTHNSGVDVTFSATDIGGSLVAGYQYSLNGGAWATATSPQSVTLNPAVQSGQTVQIKAIDNAGNEAVAPFSFKYDSIPPITVPTFAALFQTKIRWTWGVATDDNSGVAGYEIRPTDADWGTPGYVYKGEMNEFTTTPTNSGNVTYFAKAFDYADNYSNAAATVTAVNVKPHAVGTISTSSELNGVQFAWDEVTTDENHLATDDIWGYSVRTKIGAGAWSTYSGITTNSFFRSMNASERVQASVTNYIEVLTQNRWGKLSTNSGVANAEPIKVEFVNMGDNPMRFEVWVNSGSGIQTQADNPLFLNLVDGDFKD